MALSCPTTITLLFYDLKRIDSLETAGPWIQKYTCTTIAQAHFNSRIPFAVTHFISSFEYIVFMNTQNSLRIHKHYNQGHQIYWWPWFHFVALPKCRSLPLDLSGVFRTLARSLLKGLGLLPRCFCIPFGRSFNSSDRVHHSVLISVHIVSNKELWYDNG